MSTRCWSGLSSKLRPRQPPRPSATGLRRPSRRRLQAPSIVWPRQSLLLGAALLLSGCALQRDIATVTPGGAVGTRAPALSGEALDGSTLHASFSGTRTVIVFWAAWCGPCRKEQPTLNRIAADYAPQGVAVVGVDMLDHDRALARAFVQEFGVSYPSLYDDAGRAAAAYEIAGRPSCWWTGAGSSWAECPVRWGSRSCAN